MHAGKLQTIGNSLGIILPRAQLREAGWSKGDYIAVEFNGKEFYLHRVRDIAVRFTTIHGRGRGTGVDPISS